MRTLLAFLATLSLAAQSREPHIRAAADAFRAGQASAKARDWQTAQTSFLRAIDVEPTYADAYHALIDTYIEAGKPLDGAAILTRYLQIDPASLKDRIRLGSLLLEQQQTARALAQFSLALKIDPRSADALFGFAQAADRNGMTEQALESADRGAREFPKDARFPVLAAELRRRAQQKVPSH